MLTLVLGTNWKQNKNYILNSIAQDVKNWQGGRVLMVPELISHQTERDLAAVVGNTASRFAEVLSFSRLAKRVAEEEGQILMECLDEGGRIVAMAAAVRQLHSKLKAYAAVETRPEFLSNLLDAVDEFKRCCIMPGDLMEASAKTEGSLSQKLEELSLIYQSYNSICENVKRDPRDQMTWLLGLLEDCSYGEKHVFYFDGFPAYSRQHMEILYHLVQNSPQVVVSLNCDEPGSEQMAFEESGRTAADLIAFAIQHQIPYQIISLTPEQTGLQIVADHALQGKIQEGVAKNQLDVYQSESVYDACGFVAEQIIDGVQAGCRYRDFNIVCTDLEVFKSSIQSVLQRAHIPVYLSGTEDILDKTVISTVLAAMDVALGGFEQKDVLRYLKSMLSPLDLDVVDKLENYAILWSIDGTAWLKPWENHPRGLGENWTEHDKAQLDRLNESRHKAIEPLATLRKHFQDGINFQQQVKALYGFLEEIHLHKRLKILSAHMDQRGDNRNAQILNQLWDILVGALEQLHDVLADVSWDVETFSKLLKLLLSCYDVGTIPSVLDAVKVGSVSAMRCESCKHLFLLGASEGNLPSYGSSAGVLNDMERSALQKLGVPINPGAIEGLQTQFSEIQQVFCGADSNISVFCCDGQPSYVYNRLKLLAGDEQTAKPQFGPALTDRAEAAAILTRNGLQHQAENLQISDEMDAIKASQNYDLGKIQSENIEKLYGNKLFLSASQIDRAAECRLHYFLRYGIGAKERKAATVDPAEFGTYVHAVLEECGRKILGMGGFRNVSLDETLAMAADASAKYFAQRFQQIGTERMQYHFKKNSRELDQIVTELWKEMNESSFDAVEFELSFGENGVMPAIAISGSKMEAQLGGFVDRVDRWDCNGIPYVRVVDYKTGKKDFDYCDVYNGIGLQMLLYLYALEEGGEPLFGKTPVAAGVQYFPARMPIVTADGSLSPEEAEAQHLKKLKRQGLLLSDEHVLYAVENNENPRRIPVKRKSDGTISGDIASSHQFVMLKKYIYHLLRDIVDDIASGNVTANPYTRGSSRDACAYCPYRAVCHSTEIPGRRNYQAMSADRFWNEIEEREG